MHAVCACACGVFLFLACSSVASAVDPIATFDTSFGTIQVELLPGAAPYTVQNFLNYVDSGKYDDIFIHRLMYGFVAQTGGYSAANAPFTYDTSPPHIVAGPSVINEFHLSNVAGTLAMAKLGNDPNSATSEFFFNLADNSANLDHQNGGFTVFAKVLGDGMSVLDALADVPVYNGTGVWGSAFANLPLVNFDSQNAPAVEASNFLVIHSISVPRVAGDVNLDGIVNGQDIALVASNWGKSTGVLLGDANHDQSVGDADIATIAEHWLETLPIQNTQTASALSLGGAIATEIVTGNSMAAVPEPGTWLLAILAAVALYVVRRVD